MTTRRADEIRPGDVVYLDDTGRAVKVVRTVRLSQTTHITGGGKMTVLRHRDMVALADLTDTDTEREDR